MPPLLLPRCQSACSVLPCPPNLADDDLPLDLPTLRAVRAPCFRQVLPPLLAAAGMESYPKAVFAAIAKCLTPNVMAKVGAP